MAQAKQNAVYEMEPDRKPAAFQDVPENTTELLIKTVRPFESMAITELGQRLKHLKKLTVRYGDAENLDFLPAFPSIVALRVLQLSRLKDYTGIGHCVRLTDLSVTASVSSAGSLAFLRHLPELERLFLEGPTLSKGFDTVEPLRKVKELTLYAARWSMERLPEVFPALASLHISQGGYQTSDFIGKLDNLSTLRIFYARKLATFDAIGRLPRLRELQIGHAISSLKSCSQFGRASSVERVEITACKQLTDICSLSEWPALREVKIYECPQITDAQLEQLRKTGRTVNVE